MLLASLSESVPAVLVLALMALVLVLALRYGV